VFLELVLMLRPPGTWSVLVVALFTRARPFPSLVGAGKAVFLELILLSAMILVFHVSPWLFMRQVTQCMLCAVFDWRGMTGM
jgi:hypothetical protein